MSCLPPIVGDPPGLWFEVHETVVQGATTYEADLGSLALEGFLADGFASPITSFYNFYVSTFGNTKTLELIGPVPIKITWKHHSVVYRSDPMDPGFEDTVTDEEVTLTADSPTYDWPEGYEAGEEIEDYTSEYDDNFEAHRAV